MVNQMNVGGYQIIDLKNINLGDDSEVGNGVTIEGVYELIENTRKPILVSGMVVNGIKYHDSFARVRVEGSDFFLEIDDTHPGYYVDSDDTVLLG